MVVNCVIKKGNLAITYGPYSDYPGYSELKPDFEIKNH